MYNAELKSRFVKDYTKSINTANVATTVFEAFEPYETSWNADLCTSCLLYTSPSPRDRG